MAVGAHADVINLMMPVYEGDRAKIDEVLLNAECRARASRGLGYNGQFNYTGDTIHSYTETVAQTAAWLANPMRTSPWSIGTKAVPEFHWVQKSSDCMLVTALSTDTDAVARSTGEFLVPDFGQVMYNLVRPCLARSYIEDGSCGPCDMDLVETMESFLTPSSVVTHVEMSEIRPGESQRLGSLAVEGFQVPKLMAQELHTGKKYISMLDGPRYYPRGGLPKDGSHDFKIVNIFEVSNPVAEAGIWVVGQMHWELAQFIAMPLEILQKARARVHKIVGHAEWPAEVKRRASAKTGTGWSGASVSHADATSVVEGRDDDFEIAFLPPGTTAMECNGMNCFRGTRILI
jgi:hypothetical protein